MTDFDALEHVKEDKLKVTHKVKLKVKQKDKLIKIKYIWFWCNGRCDRRQR